MKKSYEVPVVEFVELPEYDCIMTSGQLNSLFNSGDGSIDFGVWGQNN